MSASSTPPRRFHRHILWNTAGVAVALTTIAAVLILWLNSAQFQSLVRQRLAAQVRNVTGGRVEIGNFHWHLFDLRADAENVVIHGDEPSGEAPYATITRIEARFSVLGLTSPRFLLLRSLDIDQPRMHLIVYPDGQTNQPHPSTPPKQEQSGLATLFSLQAGHIAVTNGWIDVDNRAASLDFQNRYQPLDFRGDDASLTMRYLPADAKQPERYRIETAIRDLTLTRGGSLQAQVPAVHGTLRATADLTRDGVALNGLQLTAHTPKAPDRTLNIRGTWTNFSDPHWAAKIYGDLDMRLLDPVLGYTFAPEGIAHLDLACAGEGAQFGIDGTVHAEHAAYIGTGVIARGVDLTARIHADPLQLHITSITARLRPGGSISGEVLLDHWLPPASDRVIVRAATPQTVPAPSLRQRLMRHFHRAPAAQNPAPAGPHSTLLVHPNVDIPVNGKVIANFRDVSLDTLLDMVGQAPFQRLGVATLLNGQSTADWNHGDVNTLLVSARLNLSPQTNSPSGEAPASGAILATYAQRDGSVDVRALNLHLPGSELSAQGHLGAYPLTSASALKVDLTSTNLSDFDAALRDLGLRRVGKAGANALPIAVKGQAEFHGTWTGSLERPRLAGTAKATSISFQLAGGGPSPASKWIYFDSVDAGGSYAADRIAVAHAHLVRGAEQIDASGTLVPSASVPPLAATRASARNGHAAGAALHFDGNAILQAHVHAAHVSSKDLLAVLNQDLPIDGWLDANIALSGPLHAPSGSGSAQLTNATVYGEKISILRAAGTASGTAVHLSSFQAQAAAGLISGSGSYDFAQQRLQVDARAALDLARIQSIQSPRAKLGGKLKLVLTANGTRSQPKLQAKGSIAGFALQDQSLGTVAFDAHSSGSAILYNASTQFDSAALAVKGQTDLHGEFPTTATVRFSHFDIGRLFAMAHLENLNASSSLVGTATVTGPLAHFDQMTGDAHLDPLTMSIAGVHLATDAPVRATLSRSQVTLTPVHITGDGTDVHAQGSIGLQGNQPLNLLADGSVNLRLIETLDPDLAASGTSQFRVEARGTVADPSLRGTIEFRDGAIALEDLPNGLSRLNGTLRFNQNRLEVVSLKAMTGGGELTLGGYLAYQHGLFADLSVTGSGIRIRYPEGVSSQADTHLRLQGSQKSLLLSGGVTITRFSVSPDFDVAALAAKATGTQAVVSPETPSNHVRLDVRVQSSPQLSFQNAYAKLAGDVDLHLRGTLASPSLLGRVSITDGSAVIAGTRYELQRGDVTFTNPVRIQPMIDLTATARVEDYDITLGLHGTPDRMSVTYRSDPPLPEPDVVALLALGRTQSEQGLYTEQQQQSIGLSPSTDVLLGGALNATVSSRVQKLFGAGSVKVDPSYLGALGNSTTRITVQEQVGKYLNLTYATNVDTSAQQLLQAEIAINRHVALLITRDESNVFSMVIKATRRYR